jgi:hypothetical protein
VIKNNFKAMIINHIIVLAGFILVGVSTLAFERELISAPVWMVLVGMGLYFGYIQFNSIFFDRLIATFRYVSTVLALEWSPEGVTVNAVAPTFTYTPGTSERLDDPTFRAGVLARIPAGRVGTIDDIAGAVIYLASPAGSLVTGTVLVVDGGWTAE